ncbi:Knot1 domain-containing protein [Psidium guajava]|nr:Knot1 domain-containing protein [Psidium guajava]
MLDANAVANAKEAYALAALEALLPADTATVAPAEVHSSEFAAV